MTTEPLVFDNPGTVDDVVLTGDRTVTPNPVARPAHGRSDVLIGEATPSDLTAYRRLRHQVFVEEQGLFSSTDSDDTDEDPATIVLIARTSDGTFVGGVRVHPVRHPDGRDIGWWRGSRLVVSRRARLHLGVGAALIRSACLTAERVGALRFDAIVQVQNEKLFNRLGWHTRRQVDLHHQPHLEMDWPIHRIQRLVDATKGPLGTLLGDVTDPTGPAGSLERHFLGDDGAPVPGSDLVAATDAIIPSMVERDPEWAGWCAVLVNINDLSAMGATPVGLLDTVAGRDASFTRRILRGLVDGSRAWGVPILGGHTQLGVPAALSVTALGRTSRPVPGSGGRPGQRLRVTADLAGQWRPGYTGLQWDSSSYRTPEQLQALCGVVPALAPAAAKDVSMSGLVGTAGMLAEASGCRAVLDVAELPRPAEATMGDWLTCFPGFAMITAETAPGDLHPLPGHVTTQVAGQLLDGTGVGLRWPDGTVTDTITDQVTRMGSARP